MYKVTPCFSLPFVAIISLFILSSCNNHTVDIPFPISDSAFPQPLSQPLKFSAPKQLNWVTVKTGTIKPEIKKLDIDALPSAPYDASGFKPFPKPPEVARFDFNALPDSAFDLDKIPSKPLQFKISVLAPPSIVKTSLLSPKSGATLSILNVEQSLGLHGRIFYCLMQDKSGIIWFGTDKGICRFDGEYMETYSSLHCIDLIEDKNGSIWFINARGIGMIDTRTGLMNLSNAINTPFPKLPKMIMDDNGRIWVTRIGSRGAAIIDPKTQTYKELNRSSGLSGSDSWGVFENTHKNIWLTTNDGADIINPEKNKISYLRKNNGLANDTLQAIMGDKKGTVWMAFKGGGVAAVDIVRGSITNYGRLQGFENNLTYRLISDNKDRIWMATDHGLAIADPVNRLFKYPTENEGITSDYILDLFPDNKQRVWVVTYGAGIYIIDQNAEMVYPIGKKNISTLFQDAGGKIWVGSSSEGIYILNGEKKTATHLDKEHGFSDNFIQSFLEVNGKLWVTSDGGLDIIDQTHKTIEHTGRKEGLLSDTVYSVLKDIKGNTWITGPSEGIEIIDSAKTTIRRADKADGLSDNNILSVKSDKQGRIWVATYLGGIDVIDPHTWTIRYLNNAPGLKDTCFRMLMPDKYGRMWIGTDKGIYIADIKQGTLTSISTTEGLSNDYISSLIEYKDYVVAGTHNKINIITPPISASDAGTKTAQGKWKVSLLAKSEGLVMNQNAWEVNIITDKGQYLWGDIGITIINDIKEDHDSAATYITGLDIMNQPRYFANPVSIHEHDTLWSADSFYVKGQSPVTTGYIQPVGFRWDSISGPYNMPENLSIPYDQNYIQFQFAQANLGRQENTTYSYMLQGIDKKWSSFSNKTMTDNYLNLPPGNYTFKVCSKAISGLWGKPVTFSFTITPPWWQTWWAYAIYILSLGGVIAGFIQYRSKQLLLENRVLEEKVAHRTNQLKQSLEDLKSTQSQLVQSEKMASLGELTAGIAHEIQNPLNFVNNFSEVNIELTEELKDELNKLPLSPSEKLNIEKIADDIRTNQEKITYHGKRADSIVKGMLQHSRSSNGLKEPTNINALADEYLRLAYHGWRAKDKSFNATMKTDFDESIGKINIVTQDIGRVILNLITNAFYAVTEKKNQKPNGYDPTVSVSTKKIKDKIEVHIRDNGNGIPQKVMDKIFQPFFTTKPTGQGTGLGLSLSYDIIKAHGGELKVETKENEFAEFVITLPQ